MPWWLSEIIFLSVASVLSAYLGRCVFSVRFFSQISEITVVIYNKTKQPTVKWLIARSYRCLNFKTYFFIADNCRILQFLDAKDGSALEKHVIRTIALNSEHSCRVQCYLENACVSYNFGKRVTGDEVCELNNSTDIQHPDDLKPRVNFIYRGAEVYKFSLINNFFLYPEEDLNGDNR